MESFKEWNERAEESGFIDQIFLLHPNTVPLLAYADWLDEHESNFGSNHNEHFANYIRTNLNSDTKNKISVTKSLFNFGVWNFPNSVSKHSECLWFSFGSGYSQVFFKKEITGYPPRTYFKPNTYLSCNHSNIEGREGRMVIILNGNFTYPYEPTISDKQCLLASLVFHWE